MRALTSITKPLALLALVLAVGCSADSPSSPTAPPSNPVPPPVTIPITFSITSSRATMQVNATEPAILTVRSFRADNGAPVSDPVTVTTSLGTFGSVGGPTTVTLEPVGGIATVPFFPGGTIGIAAIRASLSASVVAFVNITITGGDTFFLSSVSPSTGSPQGGETVTINGGGFSDPIRVTFGGIPAVVLSASATQIRVTTPRCGVASCFETGAVTPVTVDVTINLNEEGQASDSLPSGFSYVNGGGGQVLQPTIFSVTPSSGPNEGGTQVTINGDGFEAPVAVDFGDGSGARPYVAAQVLSVTRTRIVVLSPAATGFGQGNLNQLISIKVTNQSSGRFAVANASFRYGTSIRITSIAPGEGPATGGTLVTVFGQGFDEPVAVEMGNHAQQVLSVSGSEIVVRTVAIQITNCQDVTGPTGVTNIESGDTATGPNFTYRIQRPSIFSVSPFSGPQTGNTAVTVSGSGFGANMVVDFIIGGTAFAGNVQSVTSSAISVRSPAIPNNVLGTQTCDDNGNPVPPDPTPDPDGERYLAVTANVRVTDPTTGCTAILNGVFTFNPTDSTCRGD